jgi:hypothetical protein
MGTVAKGHPLELFTLDCSSTHNNKLQVLQRTAMIIIFHGTPYLLMPALTPDSFFIRVNVFVLSVLSQQRFECHCALIHVFLAYLWLINHNWFFFRLRFFLLPRLANIWKQMIMVLCFNYYNWEFIKMFWERFKMWNGIAINETIYGLHIILLFNSLYENATFKLYNGNNKVHIKWHFSYTAV